MHIFHPLWNAKLNKSAEGRYSMLLSVDFTELGNAQNGGTAEIFVAFQLVTSAPHREENISWGWSDSTSSVVQISHT